MSPRDYEAEGGEWECVACGYVPDGDALIYGLEQGHCPKCAEPWSDDEDDDGNEEEDDLWNCPHCDAELTDSEDEAGECWDCGGTF